MFLNSAIFEVNIQATLNVFEQVLNVFETLKAFIAFEYQTSIISSYRIVKTFQDLLLKIIQKIVYTSSNT